jgi:hypothetical protein
VPRPHHPGALERAPLLHGVAGRVARGHARRPQQEDGGGSEVLAVTCPRPAEKILEGGDLPLGRRPIERVMEVRPEVGVQRSDGIRRRSITQTELPRHAGGQRAVGNG